MFHRVFFAAIIAGLIGGIVFAGLQYFRTTPLIIAAEAFEGGGHSHAPAKPRPEHGEPGHNHATDHKEVAEKEVAEKPKQKPSANPNASQEFDAERTFYSVISDIALAVGFAFILAAISLLSGVALTPQNGMLWGLVAFAIFNLSPAAGLPPELPGMPASELVPRQLWWWGCVIAGVVAVGLIALKGGAIYSALGVALFAIPHIVGAPLPIDHETDVPAHLIQNFVANSLFVMAVTWSIIGVVLGLGLKHQKIAES